MFRFLGVPLHPVVIHFPIAGAIFGTVALLGALFQEARRKAWLDGAALLLLSALLAAPVAFVTGRAWADSEGYLAGGGILPGRTVFAGLPWLHAVLALSASAVVALTLALTQRTRKSGGSPLLPLLAALLASGLMAAAGHIGGTMVHAPPPATAAPSSS